MCAKHARNIFIHSPVAESTMFCCRLQSVAV